MFNCIHVDAIPIFTHSPFFPYSQNEWERAWKVCNKTLRMCRSLLGHPTKCLGGNKKQTNKREGILSSSPSLFAPRPQPQNLLQRVEGQSGTGWGWVNGVTARGGNCQNFSSSLLEWKSHLFVQMHLGFLLKCGGVTTLNCLGLWHDSVMCPD